MDPRDSGANSTFTFAVATATGVAWVVQTGPTFATNVIYASGDEITSIALANQCTGANPSTGTKTLTGTISGVGGFATILISGASTQYQIGQSPTVTLTDVPAGRRDLIATSGSVNAFGFVNLQKIIFRRNVNYTATIPALSFGSTEAFTPPFISITRNNLGTDQTSVEAQFITANGASQTYYQSPGGQNFSSYYVPDSLLQTGDLHAITNFAAPTSGSSSFRMAIELHHSAVQDTVTFGPSLSQPTVTTLGTSPYLRMRAQLPSQSAYNGVAVAKYSQNSNVVSVATTAGYTAGLPANWTIDIPDLTGAGYDATWGMKSGAADWQVAAVGGDFLPLLGGTPFDGARMTAAATNSSPTSQGQGVRFHRWR